MNSDAQMVTDIRDAVAMMPGIHDIQTENDVDLHDPVILIADRQEPLGSKHCGYP